MAAFENVNKIEEKHTQKRKRMKKLLSEIRLQVNYLLIHGNTNCYSFHFDVMLLFVNVDGILLQ